MKTFIIPVLRDDLIEKCIETIYKYNDDFYIYIVDNTLNGIHDKVKDKIHLYFRANRNLGFSKSCNTAIRCVQTPYFIIANDDVEFINKRWWQGILDTYKKVDEMTPDRPCVLATPSSIKLPDWSIGRPKGEHHEIIPYKETYTEEDYNKLLNEDHYINEHLTIKPNTVIDGITMYCSVFKTELFHKVGYLDERFYPGSGEDYDWSCRSYMKGYRSVGTTLSYVYHHWSKSLANIGDYEKLIDKNRQWNNNNEKWGDNFDIWGVKCPQCQKNTKDKNGVAVCPEHGKINYKIPKIKIDTF